MTRSHRHKIARKNIAVRVHCLLLSIREAVVLLKVCSLPNGLAGNFREDRVCRAEARESHGLVSVPGLTQTFYYEFRLTQTGGQA